MTSIEENRQIALRKLFGARNLPFPHGVTSVCSAHPLVIEAALRRAGLEHRAVLIEATCNQVNQEGGYTAMTPVDFRRFIEDIAAATDFPAERIIWEAITSVPTHGESWRPRRQCCALPLW